MSSAPAPRVHRLGRRSVVAMLTLAGLGAVLGGPRRAAAQDGQQIVTEDGRVYDAYVPAATKSGQYYHFTCEFDAAWAVLATFGHDVVVRGSAHHRRPRHFDRALSTKRRPMASWSTVATSARPITATMTPISWPAVPAPRCCPSSSITGSRRTRCRRVRPSRTPPAKAGSSG